MGKPTWEVTERDRFIAETGIRTQAEALTHDEFVEHMIEIVANNEAASRFMMKIIHKDLIEDGKGND